MKWSSHRDGRDPGVTDADEPTGSGLRLRMGLLASWARQQFEKLMRAGAPRPDELRALIDASKMQSPELGTICESRREVANAIWPTAGKAGRRPRD